MLLKIILIISIQILLAAAGFPVCVFFVLFCRHGSEIERDAEKSEVLRLDGGVLCARAGGKELPGREVSVTAKDGVILKADYIDNGGDKTAVFVHGYRANPIRNFSSQCSSFLKRGYNLLLTYSRAHGKSGGKICGMGYRESADVLCWAAWAEANTRGNIVIYGTSMGASAVALASAELGARVKAIVCDCGFTCFYEEMKRDVRWSKNNFAFKLITPVIALLAKAFFGIDIKKPAASALSRCKVPAAFISGSRDETVPSDMVRTNHAACASEKTLFEIDAGHADAYEKGGEKLESELFSFIEKYAD
ncbi:MAG: alpha/beta hydrolase [Clostridia bacterium]|nr:alpha/beta hydrolase [Clostridia bacterium]